ncbi:YgjV family protein [Marinomonas sp. C2222]|uniref:YgjV family protein n=1 Tax=Marinomonas sargassi TaxID=2984494 RepID=A0ABT2YPX4_9GAMM|nr:YgjV family protein [Marinomonas sargassi]MCV2401948.1 YgjV family protein [Marinomonas sargassi]
MINQEWIAQLMGFASFAIGMYAFYQKDDKKLKIVMCIFNLNHAIHYLLLGTVVSAISSLLSAFRTGLSIYVSSKWVAFLFIAIGLISGFYMADEIWDLWAVMGMCIGTYALFVLKGIPMRIAFLVGACCWLTNNLLVGSIGGTLLEATLITTNAITILRLLKDERKKSQST